MSGDFENSFPPLLARMHEVCGIGAETFAVIAGASGDGEILWIATARQDAGIYPVGVSAFCDPGRILLALAKNHRELLAMAEEGLRSGAVSTVVCEVNKPLDLTAGRRLQLAAGAGKTLGLLLVPEGMGSHAAETRWRCRPEFGTTDSTLMRWTLIKNKKGTLGSWIVRWDEQTHRIVVVSTAGE